MLYQEYIIVDSSTPIRAMDSGIATLWYSYVIRVKFKRRRRRRCLLSGKSARKQTSVYSAYFRALLS